MKRLLVCLCAAAVLGLCGCSHIPFIGKKKTSKAVGKTEKMNPHVATQVQLDFQKRWVDKRMNDLVAQGLTTSAARAQAQAEFDQKYSFANPAAGATK